MNLRAWMLALMLIGLAGPVVAAKSKVPLEASQLVTGKIEIDAQGAVAGYSLDRGDTLSEAVRAYLESVIPKWRFEPVLVDGQPAPVHSDMSLRLVLRPTAADSAHYEMTIKGIHFSGKSGPDDTRPRASQLTPPSYPAEAARANGGAEVYLLVKVGRDGKVEDAMAEQTNLLSYRSSKDVENLRRQFESASIAHAKKQWKFQPPTAGAEVDAAYWTVRVPVVFSLGVEKITKGGWRVYEPGPRRQVPWATPEEPVGFSPDALPGGGAHLAGSGLRLLTDPRG